MAKTVWKYEFGLELHGDRRTFDMPDGADVLHVAAQDGRACLWALVDPEAPKVPRVFMTVWTGILISAHERGVLVYVGTAHCESGIVAHIFEVAS